ncbi:MAG: CPBP family intramembrane metalloprotease [Anaerolineales bacterium]|nr:CPBP family intramembrane metalloprotease [Anaerolineales bacterium]
MNKSNRNIVIVSLFAVFGGWLGIWLNDVTGNTMPPLQSLGALVWLTTPALAGFLLRAFGGDGWKDSGFGLNLISGWKWYLAALLIYPLASLLTFGLSLVFKTISADGFAAQGFGVYLSAVGVIFVGSIMKNIFEEFAWRGYLTPRLEAAKIHPLLNHAIVAVVWWAWHLPYYYYFLPRADLQAATPYGVPVFLAIGLIVLFPTAFFFGEIRLASKTVWTTFLLHQIVNAVSMPFLLNGFIASNNWSSLILSPTNDSIVMSLLMGLAGYWMYRNRIKNS